MQKHEKQQLSLVEAAQMLLDECRMVLPGIQALLGFQLIAVFSPGFDAKLTPGEQRLHLVAIAMMAVAVALVMAPAAYHRQTGSRAVSESFIDLCTWLLLVSMAPLALGICIDVYLIAGVIAGDTVGIFLASGVLVVFPPVVCSASCEAANSTVGLLSSFQLPASSFHLPVSSFQFPVGPASISSIRQGGSSC